MTSEEVELIEDLIWAIVQKGKLDSSEHMEHEYSDRDIDYIKNEIILAAASPPKPNNMEGK